MGNINNPIQFGQMDLTDRVGIEVGIVKNDSFKKIGKTIGRHPVTVVGIRSIFETNNITVYS